MGRGDYIFGSDMQISSTLESDSPGWLPTIGWSWRVSWGEGSPIIEDSGGDAIFGQLRPQRGYGWHHEE